MNALRMLLISLLATSCLAQAPAIPPRMAPGFQTIRERDLRADLTFLASDALEGRMSLQNGDRAAIEWIASEFAKDGLQPAFGQSYLQPLPLIEYRGDPAQSFVAMTRQDQETKWQAPEATGSYRQDVDVRGELVFAGFGITAPELGYDDYAGIDANGKIVVIFDHEPQEDDPASIFNGTGNTRYATTRVKAMNAQQHGALAVLIASEPNRKHPSNQERARRIGSEPRKDPIPSQAIADDELHTPTVFVSDAVLKELLATAGATPSDLQAAIDRNLKPQSRLLRDTSVTVHLRNQFERQGTTYNVGGVLEGSD
ncbi:MAG TPA: PA domain-containing protein, partial [Terriglobales bacterium]|nr:PA domain-containing protein [Terriglobales bacterium]